MISHINTAKVEVTVGPRPLLGGVGRIVIAYRGKFSTHLSRDGDDQCNNLEPHEVVDVSNQKAACERDAK